MSIRKMLTPVILALTALVALGPASAAAKRQRTTYQLHGKASGIASINLQTRELIGISRGRSSHLGKTLTYLRAATLPAPGERGTGRFTTITSNGDTITGTFELVGGTPNPNPHTGVMTSTITGGTGRYEGATGSITAVNHLTPLPFAAFGAPIVLELVEATTRGYITY